MITGEHGWLYEVRGLQAAVESWAPGQHMWNVLRSTDLWAPLWVWSDWGEQQSLGRSWL